MRGHKLAADPKTTAAGPHNETIRRIFKPQYAPTTHTRTIGQRLLPLSTCLRVGLVEFARTPTIWRDVQPYGCAHAIILGR